MFIENLSVAVFSVFLISIFSFGIVNFKGNTLQLTNCHDVQFQVFIQNRISEQAETPRQGN